MMKKIGPQNNDQALARNRNHLLKKAKKNRNTINYETHQQPAPAMTQNLSAVIESHSGKENKVSQTNAAYTRKVLVIESLIKDKSLNSLKYEFKNLAKA